MMPSNFEKLENEFWRIMHTHWGCGRSAEARQAKQTPRDCDGDVWVQCKHTSAKPDPLDADSSAGEGESMIANCSQESNQDHSEVNSVLSCDSFCSSCSTADSVGLAPSWASESSDSVEMAAGYVHADISSNSGHRPFVSVSEYSWPQFAADQANCSTSVEEGWDGLVIWPRKIPRAIINRETQSPIAHQGERSGTTLSL